jgi:cytochrome c peroxidase
VSVFQATLAVPGRVIPRDPVIEEAVRTGERVFVDIGCADCHVPKLELEERGWLFSEPNPYNPPGNLRPEDAEPVTVDLNSPYLDPPRLRRQGRTVAVPAYTDFRLHDVTRGPGDPGCEPLDMQFPPGTPEFFAGNCRFLTARLWGVASTAPYMHHGKATTMREALELHHGAAEASRERWLGRTDYERDAVIEFLKTLQILPEGTRHRVVDERFRPRLWPSEETGRGRRHGPPPWAGLTPLRESFD